MQSPTLQLLTVLVAALGPMATAARASPSSAELHGAARVWHGLQARQTSSSQSNMQTFTGALGGITADAITATGDSERPYAVGGDTFMDFAGAAERSCDNQLNSCAAMANAGGADFTVPDCTDQDSKWLGGFFPLSPPPRPLFFFSLSSDSWFGRCGMLLALCAGYEQRADETVWKSSVQGGHRYRKHHAGHDGYGGSDYGGVYVGGYIGSYIGGYVGGAGVVGCVCEPGEPKC